MLKTSALHRWASQIPGCRPRGSCDAPRRRHRGAGRSLILDLAIAPLLIAVMWLGIGFDLALKRQAATTAAQRETADLSEAASAGLVQELASVDQVLLSLRADTAASDTGATTGSRGPPGFDLAKWSRVRFAAGQAFRLQLVDRDGRVTDSNAGPVVAPLDISGRPEFRLPRSAADDRLFISAASPAEQTGKFTLTFARKLFTPTDQFDGLAMMSLDPAWLSRTYAALDEGHGFFALAREDGAVLAGAPAAAFDPDTGIADLELTAQARRQDAGTMTSSEMRDGIERMVSYRHLPGSALLVAVGVETGRALAAYRLERNQYLAGGTALTVAALLLGAVMLSRKRRLLLSEQDLSAAVENISQGIALIDADGRIPVLNRRAIELCGLPEALVARQASLQQIIAWQLEAGEFDADPDAVATIQTDIARGVPPADSVYERQRANGVVLEVRTRRLADGSAIRTFTDVTERRRADDQIRQLAHYDALTGLANRHLLYEQMAKALNDVAQGGAPIAVIFLDLDRFKAINDTLGHAAGDSVLVEVADRLRATTGERDIIARLGGDEFVVVQTGTAQPAGSVALATRLIARVSEPYDIAGQPVMIGTSVGIAVPTADGESIERLLRNADAALYLAKSSGRGLFRVFDRELNERLRGQDELLKDLRAAIAADEIEAHYQPIFTCATGEVAGFETLARWTHPVHGAISPEIFIPLAEENGLIDALGQAVLMNACTTATAWPEHYRLVVNLSAMQIRGANLEKAVGDVLRQTGLAARRLEFEITERVLIESTDQALKVFRELRGLGARVALDNFGTGYSSLAYLRMFPFDKIKIDGSFVQALGTDPAAGMIVQAILGMGRTLQVPVAAECVENKLQLAILRQQKCTEVQGHFFGHPSPAQTLGRFIISEPLAIRAPRPSRVMAAT